MRPISSLCAIVIGSLACAASASARDCRPLMLDGLAPALIARPPARTTLVCHQAYEALVADQARDPLWSAERLGFAGRSPGKRRHEARFRAEPLVPAADRAEPWDYGHGYDRGHMTPAGDVQPGPARQETYSLANVVPQVPRLNRGKWERIENAVRRLARRDGTLYVVTGPVLAAGDRRTWDGTVDIPAVIWKAVYDPADGLTLAWVCTNVEHPVCATTTLSGIERMTGLDPFPALQVKAPYSRHRRRSPRH